MTTVPNNSYIDPAQTYKHSKRLCEICQHNHVRQRMNVVVDGEILERYDLCESNACFEQLQAEVL